MNWQDVLYVLSAFCFVGSAFALMEANYATYKNQRKVYTASVALFVVSCISLCAAVGLPW